MNDTLRTWIPLSAWWIPVWITLDNAGESTDALETAVAGLVRAGLRARDTLARELALDVALVESAVATLLAAGVLTEGDGGLAAAHEPVPAEGPRGRPGFLVWDPAAQRPLLQLWLDRDPPSDELPAPPGWRVAPWTAPDDYPLRPRERELGEFLRVLPSAGDLRLFEPRGDGVHESDGVRVRRLRRRAGPSVRAPVWAPVEHRAAGVVVWRPSLRPLPEVGTELDPTGYEGIVRRGLPAGVTGALADTERELRDRVAPGVLRQAGFASVGDLRASAHDEAVRALGVFATLPEWRDLLALVEDAIVDEHLSLAVGGDWRRPIRAWGDVLERLTGLVMQRLRSLLDRVQARPVPPDELARIRPLLGRSTPHVVAVVGNSGELERLRVSLKNDLDSIGTRLLAFGVCALLHPPARRAFEALALDAPGLFDALDKAKEERNAVVHPKPHTEPIGVAGHRARVLLLCRTLPRLEVREGA